MFVKMQVVTLFVYFFFIQFKGYGFILAYTPIVDRFYE